MKLLTSRKINESTKLKEFFKSPNNIEILKGIKLSNFDMKKVISMLKFDLTEENCKFWIDLILFHYKEELNSKVENSEVMNSEVESPEVKENQTIDEVKNSEVKNSEVKNSEVTNKVTIDEVLENKLKKTEIVDNHFIETKVIDNKILNKKNIKKNLLNNDEIERLLDEFIETFILTKNRFLIYGINKIYDTFPFLLIKHFKEIKELDFPELKKCVNEIENFCIEIFND